jgi:hypothetical protein
MVQKSSTELPDVQGSDTTKLNSIVVAGIKKK